MQRAKCTRNARLRSDAFLHATFPVKFNAAQMTALLKKRDNDAAGPSSYLSKLNTISKVLERQALLRIIPSLVCQLLLTLIRYNQPSTFHGEQTVEDYQ